MVVGTTQTQPRKSQFPDAVHYLAIWEINTFPHMMISCRLLDIVIFYLWIIVKSYVTHLFCFLPWLLGNPEINFILKNI